MSLLDPHLTAKEELRQQQAACVSRLERELAILKADREMIAIELAAMDEQISELAAKLRE